MTRDELRELVYDNRGVLSCKDAEGMYAAADELDRLTKRVAELEAPQDKWPVVDKRDGHIIGACPLCGCEYSIGEYEEGGTDRR